MHRAARDRREIFHFFFFLFFFRPVDIVSKRKEFTGIVAPIDLYSLVTK